ncbi:MAG: AAA family ATPase [Thermoguttaceae bacterium]|nr:AAA family ATPase [Thermoguttaceae bacterium]
MYFESSLDRENRNWFRNDRSVNSLKCLTITNGHIRGVYPMRVEFQYPISVFVGENGSGKSTLLALASCAFHNTTDFCPHNRIRYGNYKERKYYTYSDFFTFTPSESGISEIQIQNDYLGDSGIKTDIRKKKPSGKWNDYNRRPKRAVSFMGINRIVPPSESSPHRNYSRHFTTAHILTDAQYSELRSALSRILEKSYDNINLLQYGVYHLFSAQRNETGYTGFNMGAGENAILGLLMEVMTAGRGALIVVDEIELGLHARAQKKLIDELKQFCNNYHCQIICSTHSKIVLDALPPDARFFVQRNECITDITPNVTSEYAFGQLSGQRGQELDIFVEDEMGKLFLQNTLSHSLRERVTIYPIGSDQAVLRHIAVHYRERNYNFIAFLDGDKRQQKEAAIRKVKTNLEDQINHTEEEFHDFVDQRLQYLPGNTWTEKHLIEEVLHQTEHKVLQDEWMIAEENIVPCLETAINAGKHAEFHSLADALRLSDEQVRIDIVRFYGNTHCDNIAEIEREIHLVLDNL